MANQPPSQGQPSSSSDPASSSGPPSPTPDIFRKQRDLAIEKYASSDEEDDEDGEDEDKTQPPSPPGGSLKDDGEDGGNDDSRGDGRSGPNGGSDGRDQDHRSHPRGGGLFGSLTPAKDGKRKFADQADALSNDNGEMGDTEVDIITHTPIAPESQPIANALPTNNQAPSKLADENWGKKAAIRTTEQPGRDVKSHSVSSIPARSTTETSLSSSSARTLELPFSFSDPKVQLLATNIYIKLLLSKCSAAFRSHKTKAKRTAEECKTLKHAARDAYNIAKDLEDESIGKTMARCCFYIALTEILYSVDAKQKSDMRALKWFRKAFVYRGTAESDLAQLWIKALEAPERAQQDELYDIVPGSKPYALPSTPKSSDRKNQIVDWVTNVFAPISPAGKERRPGFSGTGVSPRNIRRSSNFSPTKSTSSNRELLLRSGPVGVRDLDDLSEREIKI
ncbi:hypothetical protein Slin15195_G103050 [Septoria linicola]|uniref:Uncharacterized protein n=1 Tax=Septoria linicola TaxID=215465 RepID=A0A9Q9EMN7_9PEZI|nr:hypothetical protein Slin15195_G103050 [Septoria linicola]